MKPAVSNIPWSDAEDAQALQMLAELSVTDLEIAPTRFWLELRQATVKQAAAAAETLADSGVRVSAFQALLFGQPDLKVFAEDGGQACLSYLQHVCDLASAMEARGLVFGSPKNRRREDLPLADAWTKGREFFSKLGEIAAVRKVIVCVEPNPTAYGCDFLENIESAARMVEEVDSPGLALNVDMGELIMNGADVTRAITTHSALAGHFHASEPNLEPFTTNLHAHQAAAAALRQSGYEGLVSLEMKAPAGGISVVQQSLISMRDVYFPRLSHAH